MRELGEYLHLSVEADLASLFLFITNVLGWSREEAEVYGAQTRTEVRAKKVHAFFPVVVVVGRKPG